MTISMDTPLKKNMVIKLKHDIELEGEIFPKDQITAIIAAGSRIATARMVTITQQTYEAVFKLEELREKFELVPMLSEPELNDWTCKPFEINYRGMESIDYILRHKRKLVGKANSFGGRLTSADITYPEWKALVAKTYELCKAESACKVRPFAVSVTEAEAILVKHIASPLKNYMSLHQVAIVEMAKRDRVFSAAV